MQGNAQKVIWTLTGAEGAALPDREARKEAPQDASATEPTLSVKVGLKVVNGEAMLSA
jgi:hypothetical protein